MDQQRVSDGQSQLNLPDYSKVVRISSAVGTASAVGDIIGCQILGCADGRNWRLGSHPMEAKD
jgi:hypothetical protein